MVFEQNKKFVYFVVQFFKNCTKKYTNCTKKYTNLCFEIQLKLLKFYVPYVV